MVSGYSVGFCRRIVILLTAIAALVLLPSAVAEEVTIVGSGTCGPSLTWRMDSEGVLTISGKGSMTDYVKSTAPWNCYSSVSGKQINSVVIEEGVTSIGDYAFYNRYIQESISLPDSLIEIGKQAFYINSFVHLVPPDVYVGSVDDWLDIWFVDSLSNPFSIGRGGNLYIDNVLADNITISDGETSIHDFAFYSCDWLTSVSIPESVTDIGVFAFQGCGALENVYAESLEGWLNLSFESFGNPMCHAENLYFNGVLAEDILIPDHITSIGNYAFYSCDSLKNVRISDGVTSIGEYAFSYCDNLNSISIPDSITSIGEYAFLNADNVESVYAGSLEGWLGIEFEAGNSNPMYRADNDRLYFDNVLAENISIPDGISAVGNYAFFGCSSLKSVTIPESVASIGNYAFRSCTGLEKLVFLRREDFTIGDYVLSTNAVPTIYCFENSDAWLWAQDNDYPHAVISISDIDSPLKLDLPADLKLIETEAFAGAAAKYVIIPDGCSSIGSKAFANSPTLKYIYMPDSVISIAADAFNGSQNVEFFCESENFAVQYAMDNDIPCAITG